MNKLTPHQIQRLGLDELDRVERHPISLLVENVRSAHNVGSMLRTADALRLDHVYLTGFSPDGNHRGVNKAALGAQDTVPWSHHTGTLEVLEQLKTDGHIIAAIEITDTPCHARSVPRDHFPLVLVVGNEVDGISNQVLERCDLALELPQFGNKQSLNVAVAFAVMGYDVARHWIALNQIKTTHG